MNDTTSFLLRISKNLKSQLESIAKDQNRSLNSLLQNIIEDFLSNRPDSATSLENRQFIGQIVSNTQVDSKNGLVQVNGIFYRYLIESNLSFDSTKKYIVIEANGNILTLRPIK
ncbi:hypothetical protein LB941_06605 [Ligilactobacillus sp. WILCCON 0076]|uniref:Arc-like DNA binding domain-containing protein n=1 Tax=Ligilactobacillus ubinensis TaxID=2876789 RepID=A0A9X2FKR1_9LACO|nr:hypothetical protein [Ligilactobacillus ubinensis]MCP0887004.1 hypothetical protein [Ligilactobacillus ubinensis]